MIQITRIFNEKIGVNTESEDEDIKRARESLEKRTAHALTHFTFKRSTPNSLVGETTEPQFFHCTVQELSILSTKGILPISSVRIPNPKMVGFIKKVPVVPKIILEQCDDFFKKSNNLIKELTFQDVLYELKS